jgi:hypothetical protein
MTTAVATTTQTPMDAFQAKLKEKLRDDIAQLLPDEVIASMVERVVNEEFFTKKTVRTNPSSWSDHSTKELPSPFQEMVLQAAKPMVEEAVRKVITDNAERITKQVDDTVKNGLLSMCLTQIDYTLTNVIQRQLGGVDLPTLTQALRDAGVRGV